MNKRRRHRAKRASRNFKSALLAFARMEATVREEWQRVGFVGSENIRKMLRESEAWMRTPTRDLCGECAADSLRRIAEKAASERGVTQSFLHSAVAALVSGYDVRDVRDDFMRGVR